MASFTIRRPSAIMHFARLSLRLFTKDPTVHLNSRKTVLFLCTGNYYRSRFAEILFNWHAEKKQLPWRATSRGLALDASNLGNMSRYTLRHLGRLEIPVDDYQRLPEDLTLADLSSAQQIIAVKETEHRPLMSSRFPAWVEKVEFWEVHDVDCAEPEDALPHLEREVAGLLDRLTANRKIA